MMNYLSNTESLMSAVVDEEMYKRLCDIRLGLKVRDHTFIYVLVKRSICKMMILCEDDSETDFKFSFWIKAKPKVF